MLTTSQHRFNQAANSYDHHSHLQLQVGNKLIAMLKALALTPHRIIDLGCGTGNVTQQLSDTFSLAELHATDQAHAALQHARTRLTKSNHHIYYLNFDDLNNTDSRFDLVFANMSLQWSLNLELLFNSLHQIMNKQSCVAFSLPLFGTLAELTPFFARNDFHTAVHIENMLLQSGYQLLASHSEAITLSFSNTLQALRSIKAVGANHVNHREQKGLSGKNILRQLQLTQLTYQIGYFMVSKCT